MRNPLFVRKWAPLLALLALINAACSCWLFRHDPPNILDEPANPNVTTTVTPTPACSIHFTNPSGASITNYGPVEFDWTSVAIADHYVFEIEPPVGLPDNFNVNGTSKTIYIENYQEGGNYRFFVDADDQHGNMLCFAEIDFTKDVYTPPEPHHNGSSGNPQATPCVSMTHTCP